MSDQVLTGQVLKDAIEAGFIRVAELLSLVSTESKARDGKLTLLTTQNKTDLVSAINELNAAISNATVINDDEVGLNSTLSSHEIVARINQAVASILGGVDTDSDTLQELAEQIKAQVATSADAGFLSLNAAQLFSSEQQQQGRDNLGLGALATKSTEIDDLSTGTQNTWSAAKVQETVNDAVNALTADTLSTQADFVAVINATWSQANVQAEVPQAQPEDPAPAAETSPSESEQS